MTNEIMSKKRNEDHIGDNYFKGTIFYIIFF